MQVYRLARMSPGVRVLTMALLALPLVFLIVVLNGQKDVAVALVMLSMVTIPPLT